MQALPEPPDDLPKVARILLMTRRASSSRLGFDAGSSRSGSSRGGAAALLAYITIMPLTSLFELGETAWHATAFRTVAAASKV